jgi:hypothetical protein
MAITTNDGLTAALGGASVVDWQKAAYTAEAAGAYHHLGRVTGWPGLETTVDANTRVTSTFAGYIPYTTATGSNQKYLGYLSVYGATACTIILADDLWHSTWIMTSAVGPHTVASTYWGRDITGTTNGVGVSLWLEFHTASTVAVATRTVSVSYTNSDGTTGKVGTGQHAIAATPVAGYCVPFALADGDRGVRSVETLTWSSELSTGGGGAAICRLVAKRLVAAVPIAVANTGGDRNFYDIGEKLYDGTALKPMQLPSATGMGIMAGQIKIIEG